MWASPRRQAFLRPLSNLKVMLPILYQERTYFLLANKLIWDSNHLAWNSEILIINIFLGLSVKTWKKPHMTLLNAFLEGLVFYRTGIKKQPCVSNQLPWIPIYGFESFERWKLWCIPVTAGWFALTTALSNDAPK